MGPAAMIFGQTLSTQMTVDYAYILIITKTFPRKVNNKECR